MALSRYGNELLDVGWLSTAAPPLISEQNRKSAIRLANTSRKRMPAAIRAFWDAAGVMIATTTTTTTRRNLCKEQYLTSMTL